MNEIEKRVFNLLNEGMPLENVMNALLFKKFEIEDIGKAMVRITKNVNLVHELTGLSKMWLIAQMGKRI